MRKSTLFISAVLTTFVMAMLAGVASAYQGILAKNQQPAPQAQAQSVTSDVAESVSAPVAAPAFTPEQAAALAAQVLGHDDLFSVEVTDLNGETVYLVTFTSGDLVYVSLDGQILSIGKVPVETVVVSTGGGGGHNNDDSGQQVSSGQNQEEHESEHEENDEPEDHD